MVSNEKRRLSTSPLRAPRQDQDFWISLHTEMLRAATLRFFQTPVVWINDNKVYTLFHQFFEEHATEPNADTNAQPSEALYSLDEFCRTRGQLMDRNFQNTLNTYGEKGDGNMEEKEQHDQSLHITKKFWDECRSSDFDINMRECEDMFRVMEFKYLIDTQVDELIPESMFQEKKPSLKRPVVKTPIATEPVVVIDYTRYSRDELRSEMRVLKALGDKSKTQYNKGVPEMIREAKEYDRQNPTKPPFEHYIETEKLKSWQME